MRLLYNIIQNVNENTADYLVRFRNFQKLNKACNGSLIKKFVQENWMKILYPLHVTGFDTIPDDDKKEAETEGEEILSAILYLENPYKARFYDLKKLVKNNILLNKAVCPSTDTVVHSLI